MRLETVGKRYGMRQPWVVRGVTAELPAGRLIRVAAVHVQGHVSEDGDRPGAARGPGGHALELRRDGGVEVLAGPAPLAAARAERLTISLETTRAADVIGQVRAIDGVRVISVDVAGTLRPGAAGP
jgi:hypothetical protein